MPPILFSLALILSLSRHKKGKERKWTLKKARWMEIWLEQIAMSLLSHPSAIRLVSPTDRAPWGAVRTTLSALRTPIWSFFPDLVFPPLGTFLSPSTLGFLWAVNQGLRPRANMNRHKTGAGQLVSPFTKHTDRLEGGPRTKIGLGKRRVSLPMKDLDWSQWASPFWQHREIVPESEAKQRNTQLRDQRQSWPDCRSVLGAAMPEAHWAQYLRHHIFLLLEWLWIWVLVP